MSLYQQPEERTLENVSDAEGYEHYSERLRFLGRLFLACCDSVAHLQFSGS